MPLIPQQSIVSVTAIGGNEPEAIKKLDKELEAYPPVRVVSIASRSIMDPLRKAVIGVALTAVVETV